MKINGLGSIFSGGRGIEAFDSVLRHGPPPPAYLDVPGFSHPLPALRVESAVLSDREALKSMRRADRFSKMTLLAAWDAWQDAGPPAVAPERVAAIVATGLGPHVRTFKFLDGILDFGDSSVSPTDFSHSVHNTAAGYITARLGLNGPAMTITDFNSAFHQALVMAQCWLAEKRCDLVLLSAAEELGEVLLHVRQRLLHRQSTADGEEPPAPPGEGAVCMALSSTSTENDYATISPLSLATRHSSNLEKESTSPADLSIIDSNCFSRTPERRKEKVLSPAPAARTRDYTPCYGSMMSGLAWQSAAAALSIKKQTLYPAPSVTDKEQSETEKAQAETTELREIECLKLSENEKVSGALVRL